ncbi:hypothetical protein Agub_g6432, partial [Astrephomene gubernaculifera]
NITSGILYPQARPTAIDRHTPLHYVTHYSYLNLCEFLFLTYRSNSSTLELTTCGVPMRRLRVLCIHSFRTSGSIFKQQLQRAGLLEALEDLVEFTFVDAPHPASGHIPRDVGPYFQGPYFEWFTAEEVGDRVEFDEAKVEASERFLLDVLTRQGPFDGIMG